MDPAARETERQLWRELAQALERAQVALLDHDLDSFQACTQAQQICCREIAAIPASSRGIEDPALVQLRRRVWYLSRVESALLRRALRSLVILRNLAGPSLYQAGHQSNEPASNPGEAKG
jgi:hypothetical protein